MEGMEKATFGKWEIKFWWRRGTVTSKAVWDEANTTISTDAQGYVSGRTSHTYRHEIWLTAPDGAQWFHKAADFVLPYDTGHVLDFLYAEDAKHSYVVQVINRTANLSVQMNQPTTDLLHRHGWGTARVLLVLLIGLWLGPKLILSDVEKRADEVDRQTTKILAPRIEAAREQYRDDMSAAGNSQLLRRRASYREDRELSAISEQQRLPYANFSKLTAIFGSGDYDLIIWGVAFLVFCHAWFRHCKPRYQKAMIRKIDDLKNQWLQSGR